MVTSVRIMEGSKMKKRLSKIQVAMRSTGVTSRFNEHGLFAVTPVDEIFYKLTACRRDEDGRTCFVYRLVAQAYWHDRMNLARVLKGMHRDVYSLLRGANDGVERAYQ